MSYIVTKDHEIDCPYCDASKIYEINEIISNYEFIDYAACKKCYVLFDKDNIYLRPTQLTKDEVKDILKDVPELEFMVII